MFAVELRSSSDRQLFEPMGLAVYIEKSGHLSKIKENYWLEYRFLNTVYFEDEFYNIVN